MSGQNSTSSAQMDSSRTFLSEVYRSLHYADGALYDATSLPDENSKNDWVDKGDWLSLAAEIGAEKVFFVNNDPVLVFCAQDPKNDQEVLDLFRRYWCMARPQCLFLALPGELRVYSLNQDPAYDVKTWRDVKPLEIVRKVADVAEVLHDFRREQVETGRLFEERRFGDIDQRADKRLINDLKLVRQALLSTGLNPRYAHALIGRSIFIRYLEDREILTSSDFEKVASQSPLWLQLLLDKPSKPILSATLHDRWFDRVLQDKTFTYALFHELAILFNGDMFPRDQQEEDAVDQTHLDLLRHFLMGDVDPNQPALFLWAYDFEIVPTDLISSIYEEFYHANNDDDKGTHYTPSVLVEYVSSQVLTERCLAQNPRILDPACGSGIFLVDAFRRVIRYKVKTLGRHLDSEELLEILRQQITGIEVNLEAVHVAAFSLYLALLHYQNPPSIRANLPLPHLIYRAGETENGQSYGILFNYNSFSLIRTEYDELVERLNNQARFKKRSELQRFVEATEILPLDEHSLDVVVGNPPWGASNNIAQDIQKGWCDAFGWSNGYKDPSQAFIARILTLLKPGGECGLLVSTGVFLKGQDRSEEFRQLWLESTTLITVANFAHVRHVFFGADSPFAFVHFKSSRPDRNHKIQYWSAKRTQVVDRLQVVILSQTDLKQINQHELQQYSYLWKTYWWGSHRDAALIKQLALNVSLGEFIRERVGVESHRGFKWPSRKTTNKPSDWLNEFKQLPSEDFQRYGKIDKSKLLPVPNDVLDYGSRVIYEGWRILVKRTFDNRIDDRGIIVSRLDSVPYSSSAVVGFSVDKLHDWERKILLGILWSSLARYYQFLISSGWGIYHYEIVQTELMSLPIRFPKNEDLTSRIISLVEKLQNWKYNELLVQFDGPQFSDLQSLEEQLDEAIYELYGLSQAERELIKDMCGIGLNLLYRESSRGAVSRMYSMPSKLSGTLDDLRIQTTYEVSMQSYLQTFLRIWNRELEPTGEFSWQIIRPENVPMIAVVFTTLEKGQTMLQASHEELSEWNTILRRCSEALDQPISRMIYIDGLVRVVTDTHIYIIRRDERRLWTNSMAREDADATRLQAIYLSQSNAT